MKYVILITFALTPLWAKEDISTTFSVEEYRDIIQSVVTRQPQNKEVMYLSMLYQIPASIRYDDRHLANLERMLLKTSNRYFEKSYHQDPTYKTWMIELIREFRSFNEDKEREIVALAHYLDAGSHTIGNSINNMGSYQLLFLIRYLSSQKHRVLIAKANKKRSITTTSLLVVLQEEQNSRTNRAS